MASYTTLLQTPFDSISPEDDDFLDELLRVAGLFRPFSVAMDEFIRAHGYDGDIHNVDAKVRFIQDAFERAGMEHPREIRQWFTEEQPIQRDTAFQICFAFGLDGTETDEFFRRIFARERSFDCHRVSEAVYYFCLNNGLTWADVQGIHARITLPEHTEAGSTVVYTASIIRELNRIGSKQELIDWLNDHMTLFNTNNATAYRMIREMWNRAAQKDGLLERECQQFVSVSDDPVSGTRRVLKRNTDGVRLWDAYLAIFQLDKRQVSGLEAERSIKPILSKLHATVRDSFPDRQGMTLILQGKHVSYERVRKWLILLLFYTWWAKKALAGRSYRAEENDADRFLAFADQALAEAGYPELYIGNPYDWIFLYCAKDDEPLRLFREIFNALLGEKLEKRS